MIFPSFAINTAPPGSSALNTESKILSKSVEYEEDLVLQLLSKMMIAKRKIDSHKPVLLSKVKQKHACLFMICN